MASIIDSSILSFGPGVTQDNFDKVIACPQFKTWVAKQDPAFIYHNINIDHVTMFGPRPGLIHITTDVTFNGMRSKRVIFMRGGAIGVLFKLTSKQTRKTYVIYVRQPRNAVGSRDLIEIVAGMLDGATGTLAANGIAAKEIKEETGIEILKDDLILLGTGLPSPGGCDEWIDLYLVHLTANDSFIQGLIGKQTGELGSDEQITLGIAEYNDFKTMLLDGRCMDFKAMSAIMMYETKLARREISDAPTRDLTPPTPEEIADPMNCDLHRCHVTGGLGYTRNGSGNYSMFAPPCSGCRIGMEETEADRKAAEAYRMGVEAAKAEAHLSTCPFKEDESYGEYTSWLQGYHYHLKYGMTSLSSSSSNAAGGAGGK
jgi:ADP-sugar diphosphatase